MHSAPQRPVLLAIFVAVLFLSACGSSALSIAPQPVFTNTPGTTATQGSTYTYQIQTEPSTGITFTLANAPPGATLVGNTVTWTPTTVQARVPNQFVVTATTSGGSATQSWSVTPAGTVNGSKVDKHWTPSGPVPTPFDWTKTPVTPTALVPEPDGSFLTIEGSGNSDGTFSIPDVPGGYYWLEIPVLSGGTSYWTSSSTVDLGQEFDSQVVPFAQPGTTTFQVDYSGLDPLQIGDSLSFWWGTLSLSATSSLPAGATTFTLGPITGSVIQSPPPSPAFLLEYEPETLGPLNTLRLGPAAMTPNLELQNGTTNTVSATLTPSPQKSFPLSIKGSAWPELFGDAGPGPVSVGQSGLTLSVLPFVTDDSPPSGVALPLLAESQSSLISVLPGLGVGVANECPQSRQDPLGFIVGGSPITVDQDFGMATYGDPFPSDWQRAFSFCQSATASLPFPGSSVPVPFPFVDSQSTAIPTSQVVPLIGHLQNPMIDDTSLSQPQTIPVTGVTLNWTPPVGTAPTGYEIGADIVAVSTNGVSFSESIAASGVFYTTKTSAVLPPLQSGKTYVFIITAILDGAANFETQPNRSALPTASASVISAPITTQ